MFIVCYMSYHILHNRMMSSTKKSTYCIGRRTVEKGPQSAVQNQAAGNAKGDFNAQVKEESVFKRSYNKETNRNGNLLLDLVIENEQIPLNSHFLKKNSKLWTFTYPNRSRAQIDYILINNKWKNSAYSTSCYVGSDHRIVIAKVRLS